HPYGKHTNCGQVMACMYVVDAIAQVATDARDNPVQPVAIESVTIDTALPTPPATE
ncbi:MAG: hypothetical protein G01um1014106_385, partial [Parcubacteria group bacterium Gr01-1014_106]